MDQGTNGTLEHWNRGALKHWNIRTLEHWNTGTLKHWNIGMGYRNIGTIEHSTFNQYLVTLIALILFMPLSVTLVTSIASRD